jgi:uncharacterized protein with PQ loop repeat
MCHDYIEEDYNKALSRRHMYEVIGFVGTILAVAAYVPQISLLMKQRSASDIDIRSWILWFVATSLILIRALSGDDLVFKVLAVSNVTFAIVILGLVFTFQGRGIPPGLRRKSGRKRRLIPRVPKS